MTFLLFVSCVCPLKAKKLHINPSLQFWLSKRNLQKWNSFLQFCLYFWLPPHPCLKVYLIAETSDQRFFPVLQTTPTPSEFITFSRTVRIFNNLIYCFLRSIFECAFEVNAEPKDYCAEARPGGAGSANNARRKFLTERVAGKRRQNGQKNVSLNIINVFFWKIQPF